MAQTHGGVGLGLIAQLHSLAELGLRSVNTRLRLAQAELQAEKDRLFMYLAWMMATVLLGVFGVFLGIFGLILLAPENARPWIMVGVCLVSIVGCVAMAWYLQRVKQAEPILLAETLEVLEQDAQALAPQPNPAEAQP